MGGLEMAGEESITSIQQLGQIIRLTPQEETGIDECLKTLRMAITPYYASLIDPEDPRTPFASRRYPHPGIDL